MKEESKYPPGWDEERVRRVLVHYEGQTEEEAVAEDEAAFEDKSLAVMEVPKQLVPAIREMIAKYQAERDSGA
jgi:type II secretory pathway component PulC